MKKLQLAFSPCPNDTFMFDAMIHGKIDTEGLEFDVAYEDVETLNRRAMNGELTITKLSFFAFSKVSDKYQLLSSGSALGKGVGRIEKKFANPSTTSLVFPGKNTTAFLLRTFYPGIIKYY